MIDFKTKKVDLLWHSELQINLLGKITFFGKVSPFIFYTIYYKKSRQETLEII